MAVHILKKNIVHNYIEESNSDVSLQRHQLARTHHPLMPSRPEHKHGEQ